MDGTGPTKVEGVGNRRLSKLLQQTAILVSLALVLLAAVVALVLVQGISGQLADNVRTYEIRNQARELTNALSDAESRRRGYLLTGDESYVALYRAAAREIEDRLLSLTALAERDDAQAEQVRVIVAEIAAKASEMTESLALAQTGGAAAVRQPIETGIGQRLMEPFIAAETRRLQERNRSIAEARQWLLGALITALGGALMLGGALFMRAQRRVRELAYSADVLHSENEILEQRVRDRTRALEDARTHADLERQRVEALLQDANHRIGNSLATVSSLLGLQLMRSKSEDVRVALDAARSRVHAIASAHRRLRLGSDLETASADEFLGAVLEDIAINTTGAKVAMTGDFEAIVVPARDATTIGILVGELMTNALKHAFPDGRKGTIRVSLKRDGSGVPVLRVDDDGIGLPEGMVGGEGGLGSVIIQQLAGQFGGVPFYERGPRGGLCVSVTMPSLMAEPPP